MSKELYRREVESAVSLIAQNLDELRLTFEDQIDHATAEDLRKVTAFLRGELDKTEKKVLELLGRRRGARAPVFSLDDAPDEYPSNVAQRIRQEGEAAMHRALVAAVNDDPPDIAARRQRMEQFKKLGGRLSANSPDVDPTIETAPVFPSSGSEHVGGGIDFLDDKAEAGDL